MALIPALVVFAPGTKIKSAEANSNFDAIRTAFNNTAVLTDVAKTINVAHTFNADILFTDNSFDIGKTGLTRPRDGFFSRNLTVTGLVTSGPSPGAVSSGLDRIIIQGTDAVANDLTLAGPATSQLRLFFTKPGAIGRGEIGYNMATDSLRFIVAGAIQTTYASTGVWSFPSSINANLTGTVLTASQPNITSLGSLTGLTVNGLTTLNGKITWTAATYILSGTAGFRVNDSTDLFNNFVVTDNGIVGIRNTVVVSANPGDVVLNNARALRSVTIAGNDTFRLIEGNASNQVVLASGGQTTLVGGLFSIVAGQRLNLDTIGDTYLIEVSPNNLDLVAGGVSAVRVSATQVLINNNLPLVIAGTAKFYLDGGVDTYIWESSANHITGVVAAATAFDVTATAFTLNTGLDLVVQPTKRVFLDGGGDSYLYEPSANNVGLVTGGSTSATFTSGGIASTFTGNLTGTILTAAQGNITSLGTLTSLTVSGAINLAATQKLFLDGGGDTYVQESPANTMLLVAGGIAGVILSAANMNVSNLASITGATVYNGNVSGNLTGTVLTASQTNITAVGTLTSLDVSGATTHGSTIRVPNNTGILGRNFANSGDVEIAHVTTTDYVSLGFNADVTIGAAAKKIGFFASGGAAKQAVTGSKGANAALASLLSILAGSYGLITDSST